MFNLPAPVTACIVGLVLVHAARSFGLSPGTDVRLLLELAFIPARWSLWWNPADATEILNGAGAGEGVAALARYVVEERDPAPWTALTYAVLHGSWGHVTLNCVWLAAFGAPVARRCGGLRFLILAILCAVAGAVTHFALHPRGLAPLIGASAAVSGMMGALLRFMFAPPGTGRAAFSLGELLADRRVLFFLGVWFATNFLFGVGSAPLGVADGTVAWQAHVGGFAAGLLLFPWFDRAPLSWEGHGREI